jgi:hypothetical protein
MQLAPILLAPLWVSHHAQNVAFARVVPQQHPEPLADIQGIRLRSPWPSIHFMLDESTITFVIPTEVKVQPEPVAARLGAASAPRWRRSRRTIA